MAEPNGETVEIIAHNAYIIQVIIRCWQFISVMLGVTALLSGVSLVLGPANSQNSAVSHFLQQFNGLNQVVAWLLIVGGLPLIFRKLVLWGNLVLGVCHGWWGFFIIYIVYFLHQPSSLIAACWVFAIMFIHFIAASGRIAIMSYARRTGIVGRSRDG